MSPKMWCLYRTSWVSTCPYLNTSSSSSITIVRHTQRYERVPKLELSTSGILKTSCLRYMTFHEILFYPLFMCSKFSNISFYHNLYFWIRERTNDDNVGVTLHAIRVHFVQRLVTESLLLWSLTQGNVGNADNQTEATGKGEWRP
jgi:hypothetical protein